jgi:hypothetical protein
MRNLLRVIFFVCLCLVAASAEDHSSRLFPQRAHYQQATDCSLSARIEGERNGKEHSLDFPFKRAKYELTVQKEVEHVHQN